jgi:stage II sporulation protein D
VKLHDACTKGRGEVDVKHRGAIVAAVIVALAATSTAVTSPAATARGAAGSTIRVLLPTASALARIASGGSLVFADGDGGRLLARARPNESWSVERDGPRVRVVRADGMPTVWTMGPITVRSERGEPISVGAKSYRGELLLHAADTAVLLVNRLSIEDYVRGVVPLEIGARFDADSSAVQAQAVTARSYAYVHLATDSRRVYDVTAGVLDQVYGGVGAENTVANRAIESTRGLVLTYGGRTVNAPYHSTCGGTTAAASEVWRSTDEPYLRRVSDRVPGSDRYYCDLAPRFSWTRTLDARTLNAALAQYLSAYVEVPGRVPGVARSVSVASRTPSGRAALLTIATDRGTFSLRGNEMRYVLREPGGEILNSTYFSVEASAGLDGALARLTVRGTGYGHGVGMCQWGAIGRARAGQDFRTILRSYYPGTSVGLAN